MALPAVLTAGILSSLGAAEPSAKATGLTARLSAAQEVFKPNGVGANARGSFAAALVRRGSGGTLSWQLTFQRLTGRASAAHIHVGARGTAGPVRLALCGPCRSGARGSVRVDAGTVTALLAGRTYVNVHTARNAAGEIRGQVLKSAKVPVLAPPPATTTGSGTTEDEGYYPGG